MSQKFDCPNCGAPLDAPENADSTLRCPFCNTSVIVPEELHSHPSPQVSVVFSQAEPVNQEVITSTSSYPLNPVDGSAVQRTARRSKAGAACTGIGITLAILLVAGVFLIIILVQPGGALESLWGKVNPAAYNRLELEFGGEGSGPGLFTDARTIAVDNVSGAIYVADYEGGRVQAFDAAGKFIIQWNVGNRKTLITSMTADRKGSVYITADGKLLRYDGASGKLLEEVPHVGDLDYYENAAATADGGLAAIDSNETIVRLDSSYQAVLTIPDAINTISGDSELDTRLAVDGAGNIYAMGLFNSAVFKFGADGKFINRFGSEGDQPGQFQAMEAIAVNGKGQIFVSDINGIEVFDTDGRYLRTFQVTGTAFGMVFTDQGELLLTSNDQKVLKYNFPK